MNLRKLISAYEKFYPKAFAEKWDKVGLLVVPDADKEVRKILVTNDLTGRVVNYAKEGKFDLIMCYHPVIFKPLATVSRLGSWQENVIIECIKNDIAVYATHTVLDNIHHGMTDFIASHLNLHNSVPIESFKPKLFTMCNRISSKHLKDVFWKLEDVFIESESGGSINIWFNNEQQCGDALKNVPLARIPDFDLSSFVGAGRLVVLYQPQKLMAIYEIICRLCKNRRNVTISSLDKNSLIKTIGIVPGAGATLLRDLECDLLLTGEMLHHDILGAVQNKQHVILTGHTGLENPFLEKFKEILKNKFDNIGCGDITVESFITEDVLIDNDMTH